MRARPQERSSFGKARRARPKARKWVGLKRYEWLDPGAPRQNILMFENSGVRYVFATLARVSEPGANPYFSSSMRVRR